MNKFDVTFIYKCKILVRTIFVEYRKYHFHDMINEFHVRHSACHML
jgi:hypothetical protein